MGYGGTWDSTTPLNPGTRPNVYVNFTSSVPPAPAVSADGVLAYVGTADFGPLRTLVSMESKADVIRYLGNTNTLPGGNADVVYALMRAFDTGLRRVLFYRIAANTAAAATITLNDASSAAALTVTAKYEGTFGNGIRVDVITDPRTPTLKVVRVYEGTVLREQFSGATNGDIVADFNVRGSALVNIAASGTTTRALANASAASLTGGSSGSTVLASDYTNALDALSDKPFRTIVLGTVDTAIQSSLASWVSAQRGMGNRVNAIVAAGESDTLANMVTQATALNNEAVSYLAGGFTDTSLVRFPAVMAALVVGGEIVVAGTESLTYRRITSGGNVIRAFSPSDISTGLTNGLLMLEFDGEKVKITQGINTLQIASAVAPKSPDWRKMRYIATQDLLLNRIGRYLGENYIGKVPNDAFGRVEAVNQVQMVLDQATRERLLAQEPRAVAALDGTKQQTGASVFLTIRGDQVDAMESFYITAEI